MGVGTSFQEIRSITGQPMHSVIKSCISVLDKRGFKLENPTRSLPDPTN